MTNEASPRPSEATSLSPAAFLKEKADRPIVRRRRFAEEEKRHFLDLAKQPGSSISAVAQRYDLAVALLFRWRKELGEGAAPFSGFTPVSVVDDDAPATPAMDDARLMSSGPPQERSAAGMEIGSRMAGACARKPIRRPCADDRHLDRLMRAAIIIAPQPRRSIAWLRY